MTKHERTSWANDYPVPLTPFQQDVLRHLLSELARHGVEVDQDGSHRYTNTLKLRLTPSGAARLTATLADGFTSEDRAYVQREVLSRVPSEDEKRANLAYNEQLKRHQIRIGQPGWLERMTAALASAPALPTLEEAPVPEAE